MTRLKRPQRAALNRKRVLEAAGKIFRTKGLHASSLDEIADEAGFSKGVIYSQFGSKDDLALALIEQRMEWRTSQTLELIKQLERQADQPLDRTLLEIWDRNRTIQLADRQWPVFVLEFRIHAARDPDLSRRYQALHRKTLARLTRVFELLISREALTPRYEPAELARFLAAMDAGRTLEALAEAPGSRFTLGREAVRLLLTDSSPEPSGEKEEPR